MRAQDIAKFKFVGEVNLGDWSFRGASPTVQCYFDESTGVGYQLWAAAARYRRTAVPEGDGDALPYGEWLPLSG